VALAHAPRELARLPMATQARNYLQSPVEDRQQGAPPFQTVDRLASTVAEVIGEVNLEYGDGG